MTSCASAGRTTATNNRPALQTRLFSTAGTPLRNQVLGIESGIKRHFKKADHHFIPALISVVDFLRSIGIVGIVHRIVVVRRAFDYCARRQNEFLSGLIAELPTEAVTWHAQQRFGSPVGIRDSVLKVLPA